MGTESFNQRQARLWRLKRNYDVLHNQREVLEALQLAMQIGFGESDWYDKANGLLLKVAGHVYDTCDQIVSDGLYVSLPGDVS